MKKPGRESENVIVDCSQMQASAIKMSNNFCANVESWAMMESCTNRYSLGERKSM